jgi:hypothetical protein
MDVINEQNTFSKNPEWQMKSGTQAYMKVKL